MNKYTVKYTLMEICICKCATVNWICLVWNETCKVVYPKKKEVRDV